MKITVERGLPRWYLSSVDRLPRTGTARTNCHPFPIMSEPCTGKTCPAGVHQFERSEHGCNNRTPNVSIARRHSLRKPGQDLRGPPSRGSGPRSRFARRRGRVLRPFGPQRSRQDDNHRNPRGAAASNVGNGRRFWAAQWGRDDDAIRQRMGISFQETKLSEKLTVHETLESISQFLSSGHSRPKRRLSGSN